MVLEEMDRRNFIKSILAGCAMTGLDWSLMPRAAKAKVEGNQYDAIIIGAGLGGLSCAAAFARQGFRPMVLEKHHIPGGYATTFKRGNFIFDVSLHATVVGERQGIHNLIHGFPEITEVEFVPHPELYRAVFPDYDIHVPQQDIPGYIHKLISLFPEEKTGIKGIFDDIQGLSQDIGKLSGANGTIDMTTFALDFPYLFKCYNKTWSQVLAARISNPGLAAIISAQWPYYGLPPSKLSPFYYALPHLGYLASGGYYPKGKSQKLTNALVQFIQARGGAVQLSTEVTEILVQDHVAYGVKTDNGAEFLARNVISNANSVDTFRNMLKPDDMLNDYLARMEHLSPSLSCFQLFLGLKEDLVGKIGIKDTEIFYYPGYDFDRSYEFARTANVENCDFLVTLYDNIYPGYAPAGKNIVNIIALQGYDHWNKYEADYFAGKKAAYRAEKERMAGILIDRVEQALLPGLAQAIEVQEIGTPLTNIRYTANYRGAIYGWDQTLDNSGQNRIPHHTPIKNLYLAGAWTRPGHGYGGVIWSGLECFAEIMRG